MIEICETGAFLASMTVLPVLRGWFQCEVDLV